MTISTTKQDLARVICNMGYGELVQAASELRNMTRNEDGLDLWNIDDARDWAQFLYDWADSTATDDKVAPLKKAG